MDKTVESIKKPTIKEGEFKGLSSLFGSWDIGLVDAFVRFVFIILAIIITALSISMFAGNSSIPIMIRYFIPIGCVLLSLLIVYGTNFLGEGRITAFKKSKVMMFKVINFSCIVAMVIIFAQLFLILPVSYVLMPLGMAFVVLWFITEIIWICRNWPTREQWKSTYLDDGVKKYK